MNGPLNIGQLIVSGRIVDLILGLMLLEACGLSLYRVLTNRGMGLLDVAFALIPGACLLLALRAALVGLPWIWVAAALTAALPSHLIDLARRRRLAA